MLQKSLIAPIIGPRFLKDAKGKGRPVYDWTVNDESMMRWSIKQGLDGVITDDPKRFLEVCEEWEGGKRSVEVSWKEWMQVLWIQLMVVVFGVIFWWKYGGDGHAREKRIGGRKEVVAMPVQLAEEMKEKGR